MFEDCKERKVLAADSNVREEKECGRVVRMLEAGEKGKVEWRLWQVEERYE